MTPIDETRRLHVAPDVLHRDVGEESVLVHLGSGTYFGLNEVGSFVWARIVDGAAVGDILAGLVEAFEVDRATAAGDLGSLIEELLRRGLVVEGPGGSRT